MQRKAIPQSVSNRHCALTGFTSAPHTAALQIWPRPQSALLAHAGAAAAAHAAPAGPARAVAVHTTEPGRAAGGRPLP